MAETRSVVPVMSEQQSRLGRQDPLYRLGEWLIAHRGTVGFIACAFTAMMAVHAVKLEMFTQFGDLLPYRHPFVAVHEQYSRQFGGANNIHIMLEVKDGTIFNRQTLTRIFEMTEIVDQLPGVNHDQIDSIGHRSARYLTLDRGAITAPPVMRRAPQTEVEVDSIRDIVHGAGHLHGMLVSLDDKAALIRANFLEGRVNYRELFDLVDEQLVRPFQDESTTIWVAGEPRLYGWIYHFTGEVQWIFLGCAVMTWVLLYLYFHDWRGALRPTITGTISAIWGLGMMEMIGVPIDPLSLVIPFFVTARAVSHSVQMHDRYYEEYRKNGWNKHEAIVGAFAGLFVPTLSGIVTDAFGMLVIVLVPVVVLQRIAISASIWVASVAISELLLNPIIYHYLKAPVQEKVLLRENGIVQRFSRCVSHFVVGRRARYALVTFWVVLFAVAMTQLRHITIGDSTAASPLLDADSSYNRAHTRIQQLFGGVEPLIVVVEGMRAGALKEPAALESIESFQSYVDADPDVGYSTSLADVIKSINMTFFDIEPRWGVIPEQRGRIANLFFFYFFGTPTSETSKHVDTSFTYTHVTFFCRNHQGDTVARIIQRCRDFIAEQPSTVIQYRLAGGLIGMTAAANEEILRNDILMNLLGFGTIFLIVIVTYRSFVASILMMVPLFLANGLINAYIGYRNFGLNLQSLPVVTVGVGFGIDYGLYIVSRAIEEYRHDEDIESAVRRATETSGRAVGFTAVSLVAATQAWYFSDIRFNSEMGMLLALWMTVSFLSTVTLLPPLLVIFRPKFLTSLRGEHRTPPPAERDSVSTEAGSSGLAGTDNAHGRHLEATSFFR